MIGSAIDNDVDAVFFRLCQLDRLIEIGDDAIAPYANEALPADFVEDIRRYKIRGSSGKVNLALRALPDLTCLPGYGPHLRNQLRGVFIKLTVIATLHQIGVEATGRVDHRGQDCHGMRRRWKAHEVMLHVFV